MALCNITGTVYLPNGQLARSRTIVFRRVNRNITAEYLGTVLPDDVVVQTSTTGQITVSLLTGYYIAHAEGCYVGRVAVPDAGSANFEDIIALGEIPMVPPAWFAAIKEQLEDVQEGLEDEVEARKRQMRVAGVVRLADVAGTPNNITASSGIADLDYPIIGSYTAIIKPVADANGEILLNVDGIGGRRVVDMDGAPLPDGYWLAGRVYFLRYTGVVSAGEWYVIAGGFTATDLQMAVESVSSVDAAPSMVPVVTTDSGQVAVWLNGGDIDARGMAAHLRQDAVKDIITKVPQGASIPLITTNDQVVAWLDSKGRFKAPGLPDSGNSIPYQPIMQPVGASAPVSTDGRSLHRLRRKLGVIRAGAAGAKLRIAMTGDSWSEMAIIPNAMIDLLSDRVAPAAGSFVQANTSYMWSGVSLAASAGWTRQDASINSDWPYGTGPDGQNFYTTDNGETITVSGVEGSTLRIYTRAWGGAWEYSLNGGTPVSVAEPDDSGALTITEVSGLNPGANSLTITKTGGTGPVVFCGILNVRSEQVVVVKAGNGGLTGYRMRDYAPIVGDIWADIDPDLVIVNLGTNDYRNSYSTVSSYLDGLTALTSAIRGLVPDVGIVIVAPPQSDGVTVTPLSQYRDAAYQFAINNGCEFLNGLDTWGPYGGGLWADTLHLNGAGSACLVGQINNKFIEV